MLLEIVRFLVYSGLIVIISKYILVKTLRRLAENLDLKAKTVGEIAGTATSVPEFLTITISSIKGLPRSKCLQYIKLKYNKFNTIFICHYFK